jgi:hypothetical protein
MCHIGTPRLDAQSSYEPWPGGAECTITIVLACTSGHSIHGFAGSGKRNEFLRNPADSLACHLRSIAILNVDVPATHVTGSKWRKTYKKGGTRGDGVAIIKHGRGA